jgi:hypothetical protein
MLKMGSERITPALGQLKLKLRRKALVCNWHKSWGIYRDNDDVQRCTFSGSRRVFSGRFGTAVYTQKTHKAFVVQRFVSELAQLASGGLFSPFMLAKHKVGSSTLLTRSIFKAPVSGLFCFRLLHLRK